MQIEQLDLETRSKIYNYTKKVLRKYQKGIVTGKLTADKFADNILSNGSISDIIGEETLSEQDFKTSYIDYIDTLIKIQNENLSNSKKKKNKSTPIPPSIPQKLELKSLLNSSGFNLTIPLEYLNADDVSGVINYITTGSIPLGSERIYSYVHKPSNLN